MNFVNKKIALGGMMAAAFFSFQSSAFAVAVTNGNFASASTCVGTNTACMVAPGTAFSAFSTGGASYLNGWSVASNGHNSGELGFVYSGNYGTSVTGTTGSGFSLSSPGSITVSPDTGVGNGGNFFVADGDPGYNMAIYQTLTGLTVGQTYAVSFYQASGAQSGYTPTGSVDWQVSFGTTAPVTNLSNNTAAAATTQTINAAAMSATSGFSGWTSQTVNFTATSANTTSGNAILSFLSEGPAGGPPMLFLDGISVNQLTGTPEPTTLLIAGSGLIGLLAVRRKRNAVK